MQDLRYGFRTLARSPWFTGAAVLSLALGIGANTAIFSVVNGVLLHSLPYQDEDQIVMLWEDATARGGTQSRSRFARQFPLLARGQPRLHRVGGYL